MGFIPANEMGVREVFATKANEMRLSILKSRSRFPDYILVDERNGNTKKILAEAEFRSENFVNHGHDVKGCDLVICWQHTRQLPIEVLELCTMQFHDADAPVLGRVKSSRIEKSSEDEDLMPPPFHLLCQLMRHVCKEMDKFDDLFEEYWEREFELSRMMTEHRGCYDGPSKELMRHIPINAFSEWFDFQFPYTIVDILAEVWRVNSGKEDERLLGAQKLASLSVCD